MTWWTDIRDKFENIASLGLYDPAKSREADRQQRDLVNSQIKAYQDQTNLEKQQLDDARAATAAEKRRVEEKQIRALRRNYRTQATGLLGVGDSPANDMNDTLGG